MLTQIRYTCNECKDKTGGRVCDLLNRRIYCPTCWNRHLRRLKHIDVMCTKFPWYCREIDILNWIRMMRSNTWYALELEVLKEIRSSYGS